MQNFPDQDIVGAKGGSAKQRTPVETPDNLQSVSVAKMMLALGEGPFAGSPTGQDIFLDGTPLIDQNGNYNFQNVKWEYRNGTIDQTYIQGMPELQNEYALSYLLTTNAPYVRALQDTKLSAVRFRFRWPTIVSQNTSTGDTNGSAVEYAIDVSTDGGPYVETLRTSVVGKTTNGYERSHRVDLPRATSGWQVRVRRITPDSTSSNVINAMNVTAVTEIIDAKLRYPNTALLYVEFDARSFQSIPKVSCRVKGRVWPVPTNYDPATRTYAGAWDGSFKMAWTDNPAWISYGIIVHDRFGLGRRIKADQIDKWELYRISQYCDQLVDDGRGGQEPRHKCDIYIQSRAEAWTVLRDLAAIYRGMTYWGHGKMQTFADMPRDVDYVFSRTNVVDGKFRYSSTSERNRYSRALVSYDNPANMYESDVTASTDLDLQRRYGDNVIEISAIGCTRQSEAQRRGKWALLTNSKDRIVSFQVGLDGNIPLPGYIIGVADPLLAGRPIGGRVTSVTNTRTVVLDREAAVKVGDLLIINLPSGKAQGRTVSSVVGRTVTVSTNYSELPYKETQWSVDAADLAIQQFRVNKIERNEPHLFTITASYHNPSKYDAIDNGAKLEERPVTVIPPSVQAPPSNVRITQGPSMVEQGIAINSMLISWDAAPNAVYYTVEWRRNEGDWVSIPRTGATQVEVRGVYMGNYLARVRAYNVMDVASLPASSVLTSVTGKVGEPPVLATFKATGIVFGIKLDWTFPPNTGDTNYTEIQYSRAADGSDPQLLGTFSYPLSTYTMPGLSAGAFFRFRARIVDKTGNIGPWTDWIDGRSSADAEEILEYLSGQITESQLGQELVQKINEPAVDLGPVYAAIDEERTQRTDETSALAQTQETLRVAVEGNEAAIQQTSQTIAGVDGKLAAMYTLKTQLTVNGTPYLAGIGVGVENNQGIITSQVLVAAGRFAIIDPNTNATVSPFVVQGGQVFINDAFISTATIRNALIGATLNSVATVNGQPVLSLNFQTGSMVMRSPTTGGGFMTLDNRVIAVYDGNGVLRVRLGIW